MRFYLERRIDYTSFRLWQHGTCPSSIYENKGMIQGEYVIGTDPILTPSCSEVRFDPFCRNDKQEIGAQGKSWHTTKLAIVFNRGTRIDLFHCRRVITEAVTSDS